MPVSSIGDYPTPSYENVVPGGAQDNISTSAYDISATNQIPARSKLHFLSLPAEVRNEIYEYLLCADIQSNIYRDSFGITHYPLDTSILRVNKLINAEATKTLYSKNIFISIETPWGNAESHIRNEGQVSICANGARAKTFPAQFTVTIAMPEVANMVVANFIVFASELPRFCRVWHYSDLTHLGLNSNLSLSITLNQTSYRKSTAQSQSRILAPFGLVKGLASFDTRNLDPSTESRLRTEMAIPYPTPESCIATCEKALSDGAAACKSGKHREALECFSRGFHAMHIVVEGRERKVWADAFFEVELTGGAHNGEHGGIVRMVLRLKLVAGIVDAYVAQGEFEEAAYWGRRSVALMREALGYRAEAPGPGFPAPAEWGRILLKTGVACAELGDRAEAKSLFVMARRWLQGIEDAEVRAAMEKVNLDDDV